MKHYICLILLGGCLGILGGCSGQEDESAFNTTYNVLDDTRGYVLPSTEEIDFRPGSQSEDLILTGWERIPGKGRWATKLQDRVVFYEYGVQDDVEIEISCSTLSSPEQQPQETQVSLNGTPVGSFIIQADTWQTVQVSLPRSALKIGQNVLDFRFSYTTTLDKPSHMVAAIFEKIMFHRNSHLTYSESSLSQRPDSHWRLFMELPEIFQLEVAYQLEKGSSAVVEILSDQQKTVKFSLPRRKDNYRKTVQLKKAGLYELRFRTTGESEAQMLWKHVVLHTNSPLKPDSSAATGFTKQSKPDLLFYVVDTLRADHVGSYGYSKNTTPHLDKFASQASLFLNAYAPSSWTRASGASLLTGLLPKHHQTMSRDASLPKELVTLAERLQAQGYYTAAFIANVNVGPNFGFDQGFEYVKLFSESDRTHRHPRAYTVNESLLPFLHSYFDAPERKPLFLVVWTIDPHAPYTLNEKYQAQLEEFLAPVTVKHFEKSVGTGKIRPSDTHIAYMKAMYDQEIYDNDHSFGELLNTLEDLGRYDDTCILFTSDHGEEFFDHGGVSHGRTLYNEVIKVPFVLKAPNLPAGVYEERVQLSDVYPTVLDLLDIDAPYPLDGDSLFQLPKEPRTFYFDVKLRLNDVTAVLTQDKKMIHNLEYFREPSTEHIPLWELFAADDHQETVRLPIETRAELWLQQELQTVRERRRSRLDFQGEEVEMSPELDKKLRDLGYIK